MTVALRSRSRRRSRRWRGCRCRRRSWRRRRRRLLWISSTVDARCNGSRRAARPRKTFDVNYAVRIISSAAGSAAATGGVSLLVSGCAGRRAGLGRVSNDPQRHLEATIGEIKVVLLVGHIIMPFPACMGINFHCLGIRQGRNPVAQRLCAPAGGTAAGRVAAPERGIRCGVGEVGAVGRTRRRDAEAVGSRQIILEKKLKCFRRPGHRRIVDHDGVGRIRSDFQRELARSI